jgi:hypothetical protein
MLLRLFKSNHPFVLILIAFVAVALWLPVLINSQWQPAMTSGTQLYTNIVGRYIPNQWVQQLIALVLMMIEAFFLIRINFRHIFIEAKTYLPTFFFVLIASVLARYQAMLPVLLANVFFLFAINRSFEFEKDSNQFKRYFESGFFVGLGTLLYSPLCFYLFLIAITLFTLRYFNLREFISLVLGFITPIVFHAFYLFMGNQTEVLINEVVLLFVKMAIPFQLNLVQMVSAIVFGFIVLTAIFSGIGHVRGRKISSRKYFGLFFWLFFLSILYFLIIPAAGFSSICFVSLALAFILPAYFIDLKVKIWAEVSFDLLVFSVIAFIVSA